MNCPTCSGAMKPLFTSFYCPACEGGGGVTAKPALPAFGFLYSPRSIDELTGHYMKVFRDVDYVRKVGRTVIAPVVSLYRVKMYEPVRWGLYDDPQFGYVDRVMVYVPKPGDTGPHGNITIAWVENL